MYIEAIMQYEKALKISPKFALSHYNKSLAHYTSNQFEKAVDHFNKAVEYGYSGSSKYRSALDKFRK